MFRQLRDDIQSVFERDPAARTAWEVLTCYPGLHAIYFHKLSRWFWSHGLRWFGRLTSHFGRLLTGIEIHPGATIGKRVFIDHGLGVVIGEAATKKQARFAAYAVLQDQDDPYASAIQMLIEHSRELEQAVSDLGAKLKELERGPADAPGAAPEPT